jgi:signal transduction histidine kinase
MPEDRRERAYDVLDRNASALTQIVEDVLDVSRIVSGKLRLTLQPVDLAAVVSQSVATVQPGADAKGVHIEVTADGAIATVAGDADRLQQVFWNLLSNAVKFTPRDGRIVVAIVMDDGWCEVSVADNGVGIDPKFLPHIFERFRQAESRLGREHGGLGLGLAIARQLVEMHGGTITATSGGHGQGSTFRVRLPSLSKAPPRVDPPSAHPDDVTAGASRR